MGSTRAALTDTRWAPIEGANLRTDRLNEPLRWRKPRRVAVCDLFHEDIPDEFLDRVFAVMACAPQHTFQILTKRADRMLAYATALRDGKRMLGGASDKNGGGIIDRLLIASAYGVKRGDDGWPPYRPFPNVWCGVSVEDQQRADERIPLLLKTPAAVRFISAEPLLSEVDLVRGGWSFLSPLRPPPGNKSGWEHGLDWVIVGGESGPKARPCNVEWVRSIVRQCRAASVACFVKQLGAKPQEDGCEAGSVLVGTNPASLHRLRDPKGGDPAEWPEDLRVREFPSPVRGTA